MQNKIFIAMLFTLVPAMNHSMTRMLHKISQQNHHSIRQLTKPIIRKTHTEIPKSQNEQLVEILKKQTEVLECIKAQKDREEERRKVSPFSAVIGAVSGLALGELMYRYL